LLYEIWGTLYFSGVYNIGNLKSNFFSSETPMNSLYNINVRFDIDMSFSAKEIETMLVEYENDHHTEMNISEIANEIRFYTSGYPYLVSKICLLIETDLNRNWTIDGVQEAIKLILEENSTLFEDLIKKTEENQELSDLLFDLTVGKVKYPFNVDNPVMKLGLMFGFLDKGKDGLIIHNKVFEIRITDYFISKQMSNWRKNGFTQSPVNEIIRDNVFDMELCLSKFKKHYAEIYTEIHVSHLLPAVLINSLANVR